LPSSATIIRENITYSTKLITEMCASCHIPFAMPKDLYDKAQNNPKVMFYCPNGHELHYGGKSEAQRLKERLANVEALAKSRKEACDREREGRLAAQRSARAYKGVATRVRNLAGKGVCPADDCGQQVPQLAEHMAEKHPTWVDEPVTDKP
jgi:hypothetical protein